MSEDDKVLLFKKKFLPAIRAGEKTQTIRLWPYRRMRVGQRSYIPGVGYIRILVVEQIELASLTDEDARLDGFATAASLREEIRHLYADKLDRGYQSFKVIFELLGDPTADEAIDRPDASRE